MTACCRFSRSEESLNRSTSSVPSGSMRRSSNPPLGTGRISHCRNCPFRSNHQNTTGLPQGGGLANAHRLRVNGGLRKLSVAGVALDGEQQLMKLTAHPAFGRTVVEIAQRTLEAPQRPIQSQFWMLFHEMSFRRHQAPCQRTPARGDTAMRFPSVIFWRIDRQFASLRFEIHNWPRFPDNPEPHRWLIC